MTDPENVEKLIDLLSDKTLEFGCEVDCGGFTKWKMINTTQGIKQEVIGDELYIGKPLHGEFKILGKPITKCHVELRMLHKGVLYDETEHNGFMKFNSELLTEFWQPLGFNRSLQEIFEESGYRNQSVGNTGVVEQRLRNKEARELAEFLITLFLKK